MQPFSMGYSRWLPVRSRWDLTESELEELARLVPTARPGVRFLAGLPEALAAAHLLADVDFEQPPVESVARRMLAAITARVTGMDVRNGAAWAAARDKALAEGFDQQRVAAYLQEHASRMLLFDAERPVLQDPRLAVEAPKMSPPGRLAMNRPSGNNAVWSDRTPQDVPLAPEEALWWVLAWRGYGPAGLAGSRDHGGRSSRSSSAAPYRGRVSYFPHGESLLHNLLYSVPAPQEWPEGDGVDVAPWETERLPDPLHPAEPNGLMSLLTGRATHAVLLEPNAAQEVVGCRIAWASPAVVSPAGDPYLVHRSEGSPLAADVMRTAWTDLDKLLANKIENKKFSFTRPPVFHALVSHPTADAAKLGVRIVGWDQEGQDRSSGWYAMSTPPLLRYLEELEPERAAAALRVCERASLYAYLLRQALRGAWAGYNAQRQPDQHGNFTGPPLRLFWRTAEAEFWATLEDPERKPLLGALAMRTYDQACHKLGTDARAIEAISRNRHRVLPKPTTKKQPVKAIETPGSAPEQAPATLF